MRISDWSSDVCSSDLNSLWLLPSGPDQVGEYYVRPTPVRHMGDLMAGRKRNGIATLVAKSTGHRGSARLKSGPHACFRESCPISLNRQAIYAVAVLVRAAFALDRNSGWAVFFSPCPSSGAQRTSHSCHVAHHLPVQLDREN